MATPRRNPPVQPGTIHPDLHALAVPVETLDSLPGNPRRGDIDAVVRSYSAFGQRKPIVARRAGDRGTVIAGNHQLAAVKQLGWTHVAVVWVDDDDQTAAAFALADNRTADLGDYDNDLLLELIRSVDDEALMAATGYTPEDVASLVADQPSDAPAVAGDPDDVPESAPGITVPGDVWLLGPHRVKCGDARVLTDLEDALDGQLADMVWTDPPYGVAIVGGNHALRPEERKARGGKTIENDDLSHEQLEAFLRDALGNAAAVSRPGAAWFVAAPAGPPFLAFGSVLREQGIWRQTLSWVKDSFVMGRSDYHYRHEPLFYGWKPGAAHTAPPTRTSDSVWEVARPKRNAEHPTMKPVELIQRAIANHTGKGATVLDPFGGSGSTLMACHMTGRVARLVELDPKYVDVICKRWQLATGVKPIAASTGNEHDFCEGG